MVNLKKTNATLEELTAQDDEIKSEINNLGKQRKSIGAVIKSIKKLAAALPEQTKPRRKKAAAAE